MFGSATFNFNPAIHFFHINPAEHIFSQFTHIKDELQKTCFIKAVFGANIILCERRLARTVDIPKQEMSHPTIEQQLVKTQQLLEHYFNRAQELEYQLVDKQ